MTSLHLFCLVDRLLVGICNFECNFVSCDDFLVIWMSYKSIHGTAELEMF